MAGFKREIHAYPVEGPVVVEGDDTGLSFHVKGSRKYVEITWTDVIKHCVTGQDVPSWLEGKPLELLKHLAEQIVKKKAKKGEQS